MICKMEVGFLTTGREVNLMMLAIGGDIELIFATKCGCFVETLPFH